MKSLLIVSLLALSMNSFAAVVRMNATGECSSTVSDQVDLDVQKEGLTKCAEFRAHMLLSEKCEQTGNGWLLDSNIARRNYQQYFNRVGMSFERTVVAKIMAVGNCEF